LRDDIARFTEAGATVVAVAPDSAEGVAKFVKTNPYPFALLADTEHAVFDAYDVANTLMSLGQRPAVFIVDREGIVRFDAIGTQQWQIASNDDVLAALASL
jgi:peroxiredoxin